MNREKLFFIGILVLALIACVAGFSLIESRGDDSLPATPERTAVAPTPSEEVADVPPLSPGEPDGSAVSRVTVVNVKKADAILVQAGGKAFLIDTGTKESAPALLGVLHRLGAERLDAIFLTHTHADHVGGVEAIAANLSVGTLYAAAISENKKNGENKITELSEQTGLPLVRLNAGETAELFTVLGPITKNTDDDNDNSLVLKCALGGKTYLFAGDMQFAEEDTLLSAGVDVSADVLKVGNHGNPDATSEEFARAVGAKLALISTDTLDDADSANPRVLRALDGAAVYVSEDTPCGIVKETLPDGTERLFALDAAKPVDAKVVIEAVDVETQTVTLRNDGESAELSGWMLFSERGGELYRFPAGTVLDSGKRLFVGGASNETKYRFRDDSPWNRKKTDTAVLYDANGTEMSRCP